MEAVTAYSHAGLRLRARAWLHMGLLMAAVMFPGVVSGAQTGELTREFQVKAAFLYNFVQFVEWPQHAFESAQSPVVIGVLGQDPFGEFLDELVRGETINGRPLAVKRFRRIDDVDACHVLFVSGSEGARVREIAANLRGRSVLTVCDWEAFMREGGMVRFVTERNRVRLRINLDAAKAAGLTISSKLLRSAELVSLGR